MSAPSAVRVEATSISTTVIRWTYAGSAGVSIYRSTDGVTYASIVDGLAVATTSYTDTGLVSGTRYWYKLTDDAGSTFSSVVTVVTHTCPEPSDGEDSLVLPRTRVRTGQPVSIRNRDLHGDPVDTEVASIKETVEEFSEDFNDLAHIVETSLTTRINKPTQCPVCSVNGAIVIDCSSGCHEFVVEMTEDINSISVNWCESGEGSVEFKVPPNVTRGICGWPGGFGFSGDECTQAPIVGGSTGRSIVAGIGKTASKGNPSSTRSTPGGGGGVGQGGGGSCACVPNGNGALTIKSCTANNSMSCASTKSLSLKACGGRPPYTWSETGSTVLSATTGAATTVTPAANTGSAVAGTAYRECHYGNNGAFGCNTVQVTFADALDYGCDDVLDTCQQVDAVGCTTPSNQLLPCITGLSTCSIPECTGCTTHPDFKQAAVDRRTAPMIAAGCNPCGVSTIGATVSVTDALGVVATIILRN